MELLNDIHGRGATIIMVTHNQALARHAKRIIHLRDGRRSDVAVDDQLLEESSPATGAATST